MPMIAFKPEVRLSGENLTTPSVAILGSLVRTAPAMQGDVIVVTSANDGRHGPGSLHGKGRAFDVRFLGERDGAVVPAGPGWIDLAIRQRGVATAWVTRLRAALGPEYDVVLESDHVHLEYDPK